MPIVFPRTPLDLRGWRGRASTFLMDACASDADAAVEPGADEARRSAALIEHCADLIFMLDADGIVTTINPATKKLLGSRLGERVDDLLGRMIRPDDISLVLTSLTDAYNQSGLNPPLTFRIAARTGGWVYLNAVCNNQLDDPAVAG
jgi:PAS domain-containing protein